MISVQILRGIAALLVVLFHIFNKAQNLNLTEISFPYGAAGVDLFFIISGFIMVYITYDRDFNFFDFIKKRILRILPLYWILTLIATFVYLYNPSLINGNNGETSIISSFSLIPIEGKVTLLEVGWTLRYEFVFYFMFSLSLLCFKNAVMACAIFIGIVCMLPHIVDYNFYVLYISNPIIIEFLFGMTVYFVYKKEALKATLLAAITCVILTIVTLFVSRDISQIRAIYYGLPMLAIFMIAINNESLMKGRKNLILNLFKYLGDASYSIYLSHTFTIAICGKLYVLLSHYVNSLPLFISITMVVSIISGVVCYEVVEKPIYKLTHRKIRNIKQQSI